MYDNTLSPVSFTPRPEVEAMMRQYQDWLCHRPTTADGSGARFAHHERAPEGGNCTPAAGVAA